MKRVERRLTRVAITGYALQVSQRVLPCCRGVALPSATPSVCVPIPPGPIRLRYGSHHHGGCSGRWHYIDRPLTKLCSSQMARRASQAYYPILHLELARYVRWATRSGIEIPWGISRLMGEPPSAYLLRKPKAPETERSIVPPTPGRSGKGSTSVPSSPTKVGNGYTTDRPVVQPGQGQRRVTPMFGF